MAPFSKSKDLVVRMLGRAVERAGLSWGLDGMTCRVGPAVFGIKTKSSPAFPERILEMLKAHLYEIYLQEEDGKTNARDSSSAHHNEPRPVLVIRVPYLPTAGRFKGQLDRIARSQPPQAAWAIVSEGGGAHLSLAGQATVTIPDDRPVDQVALSAMTASNMKDPWGSEASLALLTILLMRRAQPQEKWRHWSTILQAKDNKDLALRLGFSRSTLYGVTEALTKRGWLEPRRSDLPIIIDLPGVVNWFFDHKKHAHAKREPAVPLYSPAWKTHADIIRWLKLKSVDTPITWAVTGWRACTLHDLSVLVDPETKPVEIVSR